MAKRLSADTVFETNEETCLPIETGIFSLHFQFQPYAIFQFWHKRKNRFGIITEINTIQTVRQKFDNYVDVLLN